jgi:siroheme synthase
MGVSSAATIAQNLLESGFRPELPVIAVDNASRVDERRVATSISALDAHPEILGLRCPAVLIFVEVCGLPAAGVIEDILDNEEVKRVYA